MSERHPRIAAELRRARAENDAESLEILANRALYSEGVPIGDSAAIRAVVEKIAPGWSYIDATTISDSRPRVALAQKDDPKLNPQKAP